MGAYTSSAFSSVTRTIATKDARIAMIGLGSAGQTTMYEPILELIVNTTESHKFNEETIQYKGTSFTICDIAGRLPYPTLRPYFQNMDAVILVVDSADGQQFKSVRWLMDWCLAREHLEGRPLLVLANKQDLSTAVDVSVIAKELGMTSRRDIDWFVCPCSAITGEGLYNGLDWMNNTLQRHHQLKSFEKAEKVTTLS
ncbi:hypothetical protein FRB91_007208 [Serendipita sp. 411]|nr:hypothetical protein FRB91_007208 [Serendipita sp. 411]